MDITAVYHYVHPCIFSSIDRSCLGICVAIAYLTRYVIATSRRSSYILYRRETYFLANVTTGKQQVGKGQPIYCCLQDLVGEILQFKVSFLS